MILVQRIFVKKNVCKITITRLLTTVGKDLEEETERRLKKPYPDPRMNDLNVYFKEMSKLVEQKKISPRIRFLVQVGVMLMML